jgi:hypothetical protein
MKNFRDFVKEKKDADDPCWKNYRQFGTKNKNGKEVPNCVPESDESEEDEDEDEE